MNATRAVVLVSSDPVSIRCGSEQVFRALQAEIHSCGLAGEIKVSTISDIAPRDDLPLVMIYPEGVVYGPVSADDSTMGRDAGLLRGRHSGGRSAERCRADRGGPGPLGGGAWAGLPTRSDESVG